MKTSLQNIARTFALCLLTLVPTMAVQGQSLWSDVELEARLGLNVGGTAPVGLPATIRGLNHYDMQSNPAFGLSASKPWRGAWAWRVGLVYENKGMDADARVKNYSMEMVRGGERLAGRFTGDVTTVVDEWMLTLPVEMEYRLNHRVKLHAGPYLSFLVQKRFEGAAHDGYLRVGDPTGAKVELGNDAGTNGTYDFSEHMRSLQWGVMAGADWHLWRRVGLFAELKWGLSGVHKSNFHTIEQTLYPIFGTLGVSYRLH